MAAKRVVDAVSVGADQVICPCSKAIELEADSDTPDVVWQHVLSGAIGGEAPHTLFAHPSRGFSTSHLGAAGRVHGVDRRWTSADMASFAGLRNDKQAREIRREYVTLPSF